MNVKSILKNSIDMFALSINTNKMKAHLKNDNFVDMTTEDLIKKKKSASFAAGLLTGALSALFIITTFQAINKGFTPLLFIPFASLPILIIIYNQVRSINKELKSRQSN